ncbi:MAG TPA: hypothetical protein DDW30_08970 [Clostridiales bacterium]|nr:hypothetical protein [Clostridiales bacterium]
MKRILLTAMAVLLLVCVLASCGKKPETPPESTNASDEVSTGAPTEPTTKPTTSTPTEAPTDTPTKPTTEAPTEKPTEAPTTAAPDKPSQPKVYEVIFHTNGGSEVATIRAEEGTLIEEPTKPTQEGKKFVCWCLDAELTTPAEFPLTLTQKTELWAKWNTVVPIKDYLKELIDGYKLNPYSYIPEAMQPSGVVRAQKPNDDYGDFVSIAAIPKGFGEQWHMITDNLNESMHFFKVLQSVEGVTATSVAAFNNWFDQNPSDTAHHSFQNGIYNVTVDYDGVFMQFVLDYTVSGQSVQIAMAMNMQSREKAVRIQLGDANALTYTIGTNSYSFAIKYLGVRTAYFTVQKNADGTVTGQINEHLTVSGVGIHSSADFIITDTYVSAVGNKASGILGFTGYINELYDTKTGVLLGYEVRETLKSITYNTLWFNLSDVDGMNSIKYREKTDSEDAAFFLNGSTKEWKNKLVGGISLKTASRRYDIEMRTQYFYVLSADGSSYEEVKAEVPMLFVQEEQLETLTEDVTEKNPNLTLSIDTDSPSLKKLREDYATLIDAFIAHKNAMTEEEIRKMIGEKVTFD